MNKIKVLELFGGISAPHKALINLGIDVETVDYVEFDPKVVEIRNAIYDTNFKAQSVVDYHCDKEVDLLIGGSPCQDFSVAGYNKGGDEESDTRSSLMYEQLRIIEEVRPKITIWENVKGVLGKKHVHNFEEYQRKLEEMGYVNHYKVLNAVDFGIPQGRERVFLVSIRKDIINSFDFNNLKNKEPEKLISLLDKCVDPEYFLKEKNYTYVLDLNGVAERGGIKMADRKINPDPCKTISCRGAVGQRAHVSQFVCYKDNELVTNLIRVKEWNDTIKMRHLTPLECFRLMGFNDEDYQKASSKSKKTKLYHVAGNSIVVDVLEAIFKELFKGEI